MQETYKLHYYIVKTADKQYKITPQQHSAILEADRNKVRFVALDGITQNIAFIQDMSEKKVLLDGRDIDQQWSSLQLTEADKRYIKKIKTSKLIEQQKNDNSKNRKLL